jgi:prevent-host-death family protein
MENKVGIRELKQNPSAIIARVKAGEEFIVTERGVAVARVTPIQKGILAEMLDSGELSAARNTLQDFLKSSSAVKSQKATPTSEEMLAITRGERL